MTDILRPGIAYIDDNGNTIDFTNAEARHLLETNAEIRHQWKKWTGMTGQANLSPEKRRGRILILDARLLQPTLRNRDVRGSW